ncbi:hypothetical protein HZS_4882 [Henneguya salminicola]|nr:hypothetical protein HZS_4882 [Henneguya salminicola]
MFGHAHRFIHATAAQIHMFDLEALKKNEIKKEDDNSENLDDPESHDPHFEPLLKLQPIETKSLEENEETLLSMICKLYRFDTSEKPSVYKERGHGTLKILKNQETKKIRILMRRDQTLKLCANHHS